MVRVDAAARSRCRGKFADINPCDGDACIDSAWIEIPAIGIDLTAIANDVVRTTRVLTSIFGAVVAIIAVRWAVTAAWCCNVGALSRRLVAGVGCAWIVVIAVAVNQTARGLHGEVTLSQRYVACAGDTGAGRVTVRVAFAAA